MPARISDHSTSALVASSRASKRTPADAFFLRSFTNRPLIIFYAKHSGEGGRITERPLRLYSTKGAAVYPAAFDTISHTISSDTTRVASAVYFARANKKKIASVFISDGCISRAHLLRNYSLGTLSSGKCSWSLLWTAIYTSRGGVLAEKMPRATRAGISSPRRCRIQFRRKHEISAVAGCCWDAMFPWLATNFLPAWFQPRRL